MGQRLVPVRDRRAARRPRPGQRPFLGRFRLVADEENPAQPIPEPAPQAPPTPTTREELVGPQTDLEAPGGAPEAGVGETEEGTLASPGAETDTGLVESNDDVTVPVAGGADANITENDGLQPVSVTVDDALDDPPAFPMGGPMAEKATFSSRRTYAALRLARAEIAAGICARDDITRAAEIEASMTDEQIRVRTATLSEVGRNRPQASPSRVTASRSAPVLAGLGQPSMGVGAPEDELFL